MPLATGEIIDGKYRITRLLGEGGMGSVYEGENTRIHRKVAIKVLHASVAAKVDVVQRFEREAQAAGRIGSDHIVEVLDLGSLTTGERFMVMEFLDGESLGDRIKRKKRLTPHESAPLIHQLLEGLSAAHAAGIIHRDLKPDNVFIMNTRGGQRDFVKVLDFGVSKFNALDNADMSMTKTGAVMGTPFYMSPEQARGAKIDLRSDLYAVGVVMYQSVTGRVPFHAETFNELVFKIALESPEPAEIIAPGLERGFAQLISKAMVRDVNGRFQTAKEFQAAIAQWLMTAASASELPIPTFNSVVVSPGGSQPPNPYQQTFSHTPSGESNASGSQAHPSGSHASPSGSHASPSGSHGSPSGSHASPSGSHALQQSDGALHQSGGAANGQSGPGLSQSGQAFQQSQGGLAVTTPKDRGSGLVVALALGGLLVLGGGGLALYKVLSDDASRDVHVQASDPTARPTATATAAPSIAPTALATGEPATTDMPATPASALPIVSATAKSTGRLPAPTATATATAKATAAPTSVPAPHPTSTGRTVPGDL